ncbi:transcriptional regulator with XRE-family HTH domain [Desulfitispora alkaliphila]|uniref:helix-turn-helix domain-containing protein n=1 Tax=Desulfitispora alkaliphila TaxID=622674 RepID=UPI003D1FDD9A
MFSERVKIIRKEVGLTQKEFAQILKISSGTVAMWEMGKRKPSLKTLEGLSKIFSAPTDYLLGLTDEIPELKNDLTPLLDKVKNLKTEEVIYSCDDFEIILVKKSKKTRRTP